MTGGPQRAVAWKNIGVLRGWAICLVVLHHATHWTFSVRRGSLDTRPLSALEGLLEVAGRGLPPVSVPAFLFATGYFVARFSSSWPAAWSGAKKMAFRYLIWAIPGFAFMALRVHHFDLREAVIAFLLGGPFIAYWFLPLMIELLLLAPFLVRQCERRAGAMLGVAIALQLLLVASYYVEILTGWTSPFLSSHVVYMRLPFFLYGVLFSRRADEILAWLEPRRPLLGWAAVLLAVAACGEAVTLGFVAGDGTPASWGQVTFSYEGISLHLLEFVVVAWFLSAPSEPTRLRAWANEVGMKSMSILLLSDAVLILWMTGLWQAGRFVGFPTRPGVPPAYMLTAWWLLPAAAAGVLVPIWVQRTTERLFGKRLGSVLFG